MIRRYKLNQDRQHYNILVDKNANNGKVNTVTYGNGITVNYEYDALDRVSKKTYNSGSTVLTTYTYEYDANGNLAKVTDNRTKRKTLYKYNLGGRLTRRIETDTSASENILEVWYGCDEKTRLANGVWQYRAEPGDLPQNHFRLEKHNPKTDEVLVNWYLRW